MNFTEQLAGIVGAENVLTGADALRPYLVDWRGRYRGRARCVTRPGSAAEAATIVRLCARTGVAMVPQGGNTSHCGAGIPDESGDSVIISLGRMNAIRAIDPVNNTLIAEAGCILQTLREAASSAGRLFPLSLAAEGSCQLGGNLSTNAGGVHVLHYGNARDLTLGLEAVLPDGEIWDGLRGLRKDNTGYDLKQLFIGAEGTLGIITAAVLKLFPQPRAMVTAWLAVESPQAALDLFGCLRETFGGALTACELVSAVALGLVLTHVHGAHPPFTRNSPWHLLIELGDTEGRNSLRSALEDFLGKMLEKSLLTDAILASGGEQARRLWALRETIGEAQKIEGFSVKHDISVPVSRVAEFIKRADAALEKAFPGVRIVAFGHLGDGNLHYNLSKPGASESTGFIEAQPRVNRIVYDIVDELGGSISAEHGIGQLKRDELLRYKSPVEIRMMRAIKNALDPHGLMNPGKVL
ncbi:MAG: FAD-binding oxidoreductase [Candidatus Accumulibacter sp.]|jgi:FAD/FMN-containing dehydrogenase|nr:FAD-binding oxidoreductase [Accumulibacter sp.]